MNYLHYKNLYPKTLKKYFKWVVEEKETNFSKFFEHLGFHEYITLGEYHHVFTTKNPIHVNTLKAEKHLSSDENIFTNRENEISIEANEGIASVLKCLEILINQNKL